MSPIVTIIGAGSYGTAMAVALSRPGNKVMLWGRNPDHIKKLQINRCNSVYLPNILFPPSLRLEESLCVALHCCSDILVAVPSHAFSCVLVQIKKNLKNNIRIIVASKGLDPKTGRFLQDVTYDILGKSVPFAMIAGPTFARELAMGLPTAITLASTDIMFIRDVENLLNCNKSLRIYKSTDTIGMQIAGAVKNIIAIGAGISDGMGFGANARTALITRGLSEMFRLGMAMGATSDIFMGLAGLGDLILTCTDNQSRNRRFGILLGKGVVMHDAKKDIGQTVEGIYNVKEIYTLSVKHAVSMPITDQIYQILYNDKNVYDAVCDLLRRIPH